MIVVYHLEMIQISALNNQSEFGMTLKINQTK